MNRLHDIDGCFAYFLELASQNLDSHKNIRIDRLCAVAESVNNRYEAIFLYPFDVEEIWVEVREYYKAWSAVVEIVPQRQIDWKSGKITVNNPCEWETILLTVPDAVKFQLENFPLADQIHAILEGTSSAALMKAEKQKIAKKQEIAALMQSLNTVAGLNTSLHHALFCITLFESKKCRDCFKSLRSDADKFEYVDSHYQTYLQSQQQPPSPSPSPAP